MSAKQTVAAAVVVFVAVTTVLVYLGNQTPEGVRSTNPAGTTSVVSSSGATAPSPDSGSANGDAAPERAATNVPMVQLAPGEQPPQFVIYSFDGAGWHDKWQAFMAAAEKVDARFTGFLSGVYLIDDAHRDAYTGPGHSPGRSSIGFGGSKDEIYTRIADLNEAYRRGHEIGTHYNGHFCHGAEPSGDNWSTADWKRELDQFFEFLENWRQLNGYDDEAPRLRIPADSIKGGRTPCLEGDLGQLIPAWHARGMTYDSSKNLYVGLGWPRQIDGIWEFQMPYVYSPGFGRKVMAMDYNMWATFNGAKEQPETAPELRKKVRATYDYMFEQAYEGNRAPVLIANHFNNWNGDSFNKPAIEFMLDVCGKPDVYCATYSDVIDWMELQDPDVLDAWQRLPVVATGEEAEGG